MKLVVTNPVEIEDRHMSPARRLRIIKRDGGQCVRSMCPTPTDRLEVDHIVALALGGRDADDNLEVLCATHHRAKTNADLAAIAKAKRRQAKFEGTFPKSKAVIRSRGFQRTRPEA